MDNSVVAESPYESKTGNFISQALWLWRRRRTYLIEPESQNRLMKQLICIFAVGVGLGMFNMYVISYFTGELSDRVGVLTWSSAFIYGTVFLYLAVWLVVSGIVFYGFLLVATHRIIGAAYKLRQVLQGLTEGQLGVDARLRSRDYLHELAEELNLATEHLRSWHEELEEVLGQVRSAAASGESVEAPLAAAEKLMQQYERQSALR